jgi:hypothetical protein
MKENRESHQSIKEHLKSVLNPDSIREGRNLSGQSLEQPWLETFNNALMSAYGLLQVGEGEFEESRYRQTKAILSGLVHDVYSLTALYKQGGRTIEDITADHKQELLRKFAEAGEILFGADK